MVIKPQHLTLESQYLPQPGHRDHFKSWAFSSGKLGKNLPKCLPVGLSARE